MENATISTEIPVTFTSRPEIGRDFLTISIPNGWDDVKKICKKVLVYKGRKFTFVGWNSDRMVCNFCAPIGGSAETATIVRK